MLNQFDVVQLLTTKRIRFLSGPKGGAANPDGNWSIVGFVGIDAIIAKDNTIVKVPVSDIKKIASYNINNFLDKIANVGYLKDKERNNGKKEKK